MERTVGVHHAKTHLSELLVQVQAGEEVIIMRGREPVARLVAMSPKGPRQLGMDKGLFSVDDNFNEQLPDDVLDSFDE